MKRTWQHIDKQEKPVEQPSIGLGDTIHKVLVKTGIEGVVKKILPNCNCGKRQDKLNRIMPYNDINT